MNEDQAEKFTNISEHLKAELTLMDSDEYKQQKERELIARQAQKQECFNKSIDEVVLDEEDYDIISEIVDSLPNSYYKEFGFDEDIVKNYSSKCLEEKHPEAFKKFLKKLTEHEIETNIGNIGNLPYKQKPIRENVPIETLLKIYNCGNEEERDDACLQLENRFYAQTHDYQILIMKALLSADDYYRRICYLKLLSEWWDNAVIPDIERNWQTYREPNCIRVIAHRFPLDYVRSHRIEIEKADYLSLCLRLASDNDFIIDKTRLSRKEYGRIVGNNHIHLDEAEADSFLFGYILNNLDPQFTPPKYYSRYYDADVLYAIGKFYEDYEYFLSLLINHKPSLTFLPGLKYLIWVLTNTGNTSTIMKFLLWNKRLQLNIPGFLSEEYNQMDTIQLLKGNFKAYMDWSWRKFTELARETFPIDKKIIKDDFRDADDFSAMDYEDYEPY